MSDDRPRRRAARPRDPERTRRALLDAALAEFAEKGLAGARVSEIAARAGVNKQLISYYFDGKQRLYDALVERWLIQEEELAAPGQSLGELVTRYVRYTVQERAMARLFIRESLEDTQPPQHDAVEPPEIADLRDRQAAGEIDGRLDPAFLLLALQGAASAGVTNPGDVRRFTGLDPASDEFAARYGEQLALLARLLAPRDD